MQGTERVGPHSEAGMESGTKKMRSIFIMFLFAFPKGDDLQEVAIKEDEGEENADEKYAENAGDGKKADQWQRLKKNDLFDRCHVAGEQLAAATG